MTGQDVWLPGLAHKSSNDLHRWKGLDGQLPTQYAHHFEPALQNATENLQLGLLHIQARF